MAWRIVLLIFGVFTCATAAIFIRKSEIHPIMLSSLRLLAAVVMLMPMFFRDLHRHRESYGWPELRATIVPGVLLAIHFITWIIGIRLATVANGSLIVNLVPIAMPFFLFYMLQERLTPREWLATGIAMSGTVLLLAFDFNLDRNYFIGDLVCFGSMLFFCLYLAYSRKHRQVKSIWLYVVPLYTIAGVFCLVTAILWGLAVDRNALPHAYSLREWQWVLALGFLPTVMGHSILNYAMKHLRGQIVSIINLGQFVFAGILAYLVFGQVPHWSLYVAGGLLLIGGWLITRQRPV